MAMPRTFRTWNSTPPSRKNPNRVDTTPCTHLPGQQGRHGTCFKRIESFTSGLQAADKTGQSLPSQVLWQDSGYHTARARVPSPTNTVKGCHDLIHL